LTFKVSFSFKLNENELLIYILQFLHFHSL